MTGDEVSEGGERGQGGDMGFGRGGKGGDRRGVIWAWGGDDGLAAGGVIEEGGGLH